MLTVIERTERRPRKKDPPSKKRVWGSRLPFRYRIRKSALEVSGTHREIGPARMNIASGISNYPHYDQVGSLRTITDTSGTIVKQIDYDSFGNVITDTLTTMTVPFGFAGGLYDYDLGLVRFGFRDYDPAIGRWTAKDPIDFAGGDVNLFRYVQNDPVGFSDPDGQIAVSAAFLVGWGLIEVGLSIADIISTIDTITDPCAGTVEKSVTITLAAGGLFWPGGGGAYAAKLGFKRLSKGEIKKLIKAGIDPHDLKPNSKFDLFKDKKGNIFVKPRSGRGPGDPTGFNIKDF